MAKLPGDYIAGLVDGEGHFGWSVTFTINLHVDDMEILKQVKESLDCGKIYKDKNRPLATYRVDNFESLVSKVIPFFESHPLHAKKRLDFKLWKEAIEILRIVKRRSGGRGQRMKLLPDEKNKLETIHLKLKDLHSMMRSVLGFIREKVKKKAPEQ